MAIENDAGGLISYECSDLIADVREDISKYRRTKKVDVACRLQEGVKIIFDYVYNKNDKEEMQMFPPLKDGEWWERMSLGELLAYLIRLNNVNSEYATINELFDASGMNMTEFGKYFEIPPRTLQGWIYGVHDCPTYFLQLMQYKLKNENII